MEEAIVSIITPCFNGEQYIARLIESVLRQTYSRIEFILVNDGSTDETAQVVKRYKKRLDRKCYRFIEIEQANEGVIAAINSGLSMVSGTYLVWADADDFFEPESIEKRVAFLEANEDYDSVCCRGWLRATDDITNKLREVKQVREEKSNIEALLAKSIYPVAGYYLVRTKVLWTYYPDRHIPGTVQGQNWPLILPFLHNRKCGYLEDHLYNTLRVEGSRCRKKRTIEETIERYDGFEQLIIEVISKMKIENEKYYIAYVKKFYEELRQRLKNK